LLLRLGVWQGTRGTRSCSRPAGPDRTPPRHDSPQGSRTARDSRHHHHHHTNHPLPPHSRPVAAAQAQARHSAGAARSTHHSPRHPSIHPTRTGTRASRSPQQTGRTKTAPPPSSSPAPVVVSFPPPFPRPPSPHPACITPPRVSLSDPSPPRFLLPTLAVAGVSYPPDFVSPRSSSSSSSPVRFSLRGRFAAPRRRRRPRPECSRAGLLPRTSSLFGRWRPTSTVSLLFRLPALVGCRT
jgi:hypothetical protein